jgi:hypothetical protein
MIVDIFKLISNIAQRKPSTGAHLAAVQGAVVIHTPDGNVVITPELAANIAKKLPEIAARANVKPGKNVLPL